VEAIRPNTNRHSGLSRYKPEACTYLEAPVRTAIALLLGVWLAGTLLLGGVASENFFMIDHLLAPGSHRSFQRDAAQLGPAEARVMLRYVSSELNRFYFNVWGWFELVLGALLLLLAAQRLKQRSITIGFSAMLAIVAVMLFYITPRIVDVGRSLDFVPRDPPPPSLAQFGILHAAYSILDLGKLAIGIWLAVVLVRSERSAVEPSRPSTGSGP